MGLPFTWGREHFCRLLTQHSTFCLFTLVYNESSLLFCNIYLRLGTLNPSWNLKLSFWLGALFFFRRHWTYRSPIIYLCLWCLTLTVNSRIKCSIIILCALLCRSRPPPRSQPLLSQTLFDWGFFPNLLSV